MKILQIIFFFIIFQSTSHLLFAQDSLANYVSTALVNNPDLKSKLNSYLASLEKVPQVGTLPDPSISVAYFIRGMETMTGPQVAMIDVMQMFPWFNTLEVKENIAIANAKAKYELFEDAKSLLKYEVKSSYLNLYLLNKSIAILQENLAILDVFANLSKIKIESGNSTVLDAYRIEMDKNELNNQLALFQNNIDALKVKFNLLLNVDINSHIFIYDTLNYEEKILSKLELLDSILMKNNKLVSYNFQIEALEHEKTDAKNQGLPNFTAGFQYTIVDTKSELTNVGFNDFVRTSVGVSIPIYRKKYNAMRKEAEFMKTAKIEEKNSNENTLATLFEMIWKDYLDAERRINLNEKQTVLAQKSLTILESQFLSNKVDFEDILMMQRNYLKYKLEIQKAITDKMVAMAFIDYLLGR